MAGFRCLLVVALMVTPSCSATAEETGASFDELSPHKGFWLLESFTIDGVQQNVEVGLNTAEQPWIEIDATSISGSAGCNRFGTDGGYRFDGRTLTVDEVVFTATFCPSDDGSDVMQIESAFQALLWRDPADIGLGRSDDTMTWRAGGIELSFRSIPSPPAPPTTQPPQAIGRLDCSPGHVVEVTVEDATADTERILRDTVPDVIRTEEDREFTSPAPEGWFWLGYDTDDELIAFAARGDIVPPRHQVFTCSDN